MNRFHSTPTHLARTLRVSLILILTTTLLGLYGCGEKAEHEDAHNGDDEQWYISGMHPWIIQRGPGYCPICGMALTPLQPGMLSDEIAIDPTITQNIGIRIVEAKEGSLQADLTTVGRVEYDEKNLRDIVVRSDGYIETLYANRLYQPLDKGEVIAEIHSPTVMAAGYELIAALKSASPHRQLESARQKLKVLGVPEDTIADIEASQEVPWAYPVYSPSDGVVIRLDAKQGQYLTTGQSLLQMANLDPVWIIGVLQSNQLPLAKKDQSVSLTLAGHNRQPLEGVIDKIYPSVDPLTRQTTFRVIMPNPEHTIRPGEFATLELQLPDHHIENGIILPRAAVIDSGDYQRVFVQEAAGRFSPREVEVVAENRQGEVLISSGIKAGEKVVVSGQFLLDSESRLQESLLKMIAPEDDAEMEQEYVGTMEPELEKQWGQFYQAYLILADAMASDKHDELDQQTKALAEAAAALAGHDEALKALGEKAEELAGLADLDAARLQFRQLNDTLKPLAMQYGSPASLDKNLAYLRCPMFPEMDDNAWWIQEQDATAANPYYGAAMLRCFDVTENIPVARGDNDNNGEHRHD